MSESATSEFALDPPDAERLANLAGPFDAHLRQVELRLGVEIGNRGQVFRISGPEAAVAAAERLLRRLWDETAAPPLIPRPSTCT
jgi:phosphate starvation-inducible protein PhoH and related proteins